MKTMFPIAFALGVVSLTFFANNSSALQISVSDSYTCSSNSECKKKCEDRGGRWKKDKTGTTYGTCTISASISIADQVQILENLLETAKRQHRLMADKKVLGWPTASDASAGLTVMELKPSECHGLGGDIHYDANCPSQVMCSTEAINPLTLESEYFFQCVDELDGGS